MIDSGSFQSWGCELHENGGGLGVGRSRGWSFGERSTIVVVVETSCLILKLEGKEGIDETNKDFCFHNIILYVLHIMLLHVSTVSSNSIEHM